MCIVFVANNAQPRYKYVILSNRDEDFARPTVRSAFWTTYPLSPLEDALATPTFLSPSATPSLSMANPDSQAQELVEILSGRDAIRGGTWLGVTRTGRFAVVTNFQERLEPSLEYDGAGRVRKDSLLSEFKSRGDLPTNFLRGGMSGQEYLERVREAKDLYPGFSLIAGDCNGLYIFSNRDPEETILSIPSGTIVGLTNTLLEPGWYKSSRGVSLIQSLETPDPDLLAQLASESDFNVTASSPSPDVDNVFAPFFQILEDRTGPSELQTTTDIYDMAGRYAPIFVDVLNASRDPVAPKEYGTRCSIVLLVDHQDRVTFYERSLDTDSRVWHNRVFHFQASPS